MTYVHTSAIYHAPGRTVQIIRNAWHVDSNTTRRAEVSGIIAGRGSAYPVRSYACSWDTTVDSVMTSPSQNEALLALFFMLAASLPQDDPPAADVFHLIRRAKAGDQEAVAALYQMHAGLVFRYVALRVDNPADAEDITAEVFINMVRGLANYEITGAPFEAWLYRVAAARIADHFRAGYQKREQSLSDEVPDQHSLPEETIQQQQSIQQLKDALLQLSDEHQTILILRFIERKSHEEVAVLLGKTESAIKSAQHRALIQLTELLGGSQKVKHYLRGHRG